MTPEGGGLFVVLEGGDGCGKSTQVVRLAERFRDEGREVVTTREPGATPAGAAIRAVVLGDGPLDARAEALLIAADRAEHAARVVRPALERGAVVVSDRYVPSSLAYQGVARGLGVEEIERLSAWATGDLRPDLVVVLDVPRRWLRPGAPGPGTASRPRTARSGTPCGRRISISPPVTVGWCSTGPVPRTR